MSNETQVGRPRSEQARTAVLHAVDDLLVEVGYAAMTMKGIAERAGVGRQTVYRWWSTKAEILFEAGVIDARHELAIAPTGDLTADLVAFVRALGRFLTTSTAGAAYRALLGEAQHDEAVASLMASTDVVAEAAQAVLAPLGLPVAELRRAVARLAGPVVYSALAGRDPARLNARALVEAFVAGLEVGR